MRPLPIVIEGAIKSLKSGRFHEFFQLLYLFTFKNLTEPWSGKNSIESMPAGPIPRTPMITIRITKLMKANVKKNRVIAQK